MFKNKKTTCNPFRKNTHKQFRHFHFNVHSRSTFSQNPSDAPKIPCSVGLVVLYELIHLWIIMPTHNSNTVMQIINYKPYKI